MTEARELEVTVTYHPADTDGYREALSNLIALASPFMTDDAQMLGLRLAKEQLAKLTASTPPVPDVASKRFCSDGAENNGSDSGVNVSASPGVTAIPVGMKPYGPDHPQYPHTPIDYSGQYVLRSGQTHDWRPGDGFGPNWKHEYGEGDVVAYTPKPAPVAVPVGISVELLGEVMQDAWSEICDDGSHPSDMKHGRGSVLFYLPDHWTDLIALRLNERLAKSPPVATGSGDALREAAQAVLASAERPGSRAEYGIGPEGEIWHDYQEVAQSALNALTAALSAIHPTTAAGQIAENANCSAAGTGSTEGVERFTGVEAWDELVNVDDRTSPEEYPDMCLIARDELIEFCSRAALTADKPEAQGLRELRQAAEAATPGQWRTAEHDESIWIDADDGGDMPVALIMSGSPHNQDRSDAAFILAAVAFARTALNQGDR